MKRLNILVSSAGRRLQLIDCCREALRDTGLAGCVYAADCSPYAPAFHLADNAWQLPRCSDPDFISELLALTEREHIQIVLPTIDSELPLLAANQALFARRGIHVCISDLQTVLISEDKVTSHEWLIANGFPTVSQWRPQDFGQGVLEPDYPFIAKPRRGSASKGLRYIRKLEELYAYSAVEDDLIIQSIAPGVEYTINVFVDRDGTCVCAIPHQRLEVRAGEVSKAVTVKHHGLMALARNIAETLPGARGPLNIQCFLSAGGDIRVIEINARVGGGYPLAHRAGARFTHWIVEEFLGLPISATFDGWSDDLAMLRYDEAVYKPGREIRAAIDKSALVYRVGP